MLTFEKALNKYAEAKLTNMADRDRWLASLKLHVLPVIRDLRVNAITSQEVLRVLEPLWVSKPETARRVRARLEAVLAWSTVAGHRTGDNPARWGGNLKELLPRPAARVDHQPALSLTDAPPWFAALRLRDGMGSRAVEFLALTAARSGEVRGATWDEVDLDAALWTIPASRMKMSRAHRVPLPPVIVDLLQALPRFVGNPLVFPAARGGQLSDMTLSATMRRMHEAEVAEGRKGWLDPRSARPAVPRGLRSTFRDWAAERGFDRDMAEIALAHQVGSNVERAYRRSDMLERRRGMLAEWAEFLG